MDTFPLRRFCTLIVNTSNIAIQLGKHNCVGLANPAPVEIIHIKNAERSLYLSARIPVELVNAVHYKTILNLLQHMEQHKKVQQHDVERVNWNWRNDVKIVDKYAQHRPEFLKLLKELEEI